MKSVLVVDDAYFVRRFFTEEIEKIEGLEVAGTARNGLGALEILAEETVDIITLDLDMPVMDGFKTLKKMNEQGIEIPVLVASALTSENAEATARVLELGAVDVLPKPSKNRIDSDVEEIKAEFRQKLSALTEVAPEPEEIESRIQDKKEKVLARKLASINPRLLVVGGSTGAPPLIHSIVEQLPGNFPLPVVIIQHIRQVFFEGFAKNLQRRSQLPVETVTAPCKLESGKIYLPGKREHLFLRSGEVSPRISFNGRANNYSTRPAVDATFQSAAALFGSEVIAVLLTGMGKDGAAGMERLYEAGALCLGQDRETSTVYGMPRAAAIRGALDRQAPAGQIPEIILSWVNKTLPSSTQ